MYPRENSVVRLLHRPTKLDFTALDEGGTSYVAHVQNKVMNKHPELLATLNAGDAGQAAHILEASGYFSGRESDYVSGMTKHKAAIDAQLGPVTPRSPPAPFSRECGVDTPDGEGCDIPGRHLDVSRPGLGPDDIVSLDGVAENIVVPGSTTSCAADGDVVVIASDQDVWLVKPDGSKRALSHTGGDHVAIGPTAIAWVEEKKVRAVARH